MSSSIHDDDVEPGVHAWVPTAPTETWVSLRIGTPEMEGEDLIVYDNQTGEPMASIVADETGLMLCYWDADGEWRVAHIVPYLHQEATA